MDPLQNYFVLFGKFGMLCSVLINHYWAFKVKEQKELRFCWQFFRTLYLRYFNNENTTYIAAEANAVSVKWHIVSYKSKKYIVEKASRVPPFL